MSFNEPFHSNQDETANYDANDIEKYRYISVLSYLGILWVIPYLTTVKHSPYARFHLNQGYILLILEMILSLSAFILGKIPIIRFFSGIIFSVLGMITLGMIIYGVYNAVSGRARRLPIIGEISIIDK